MKKFDENWALNMAIQASLMSPCRSKRGVVIWDCEKGLISTGYNTPPNPKDCDCSDKCKLNCNKTAIHAEQKAILNINDNIHKYDFVGMLHVKTAGGKAVFSDRPSCWQCSKLILGIGIKFMWLYRENGLTKYTAEEFHKQTLENCKLV